MKGTMWTFGLLLATVLPFPVEAQPDTTLTIYAQEGWWTSPFAWEVQAVHMALLRGTGDSHSQVLFFFGAKTTDMKLWKWNVSTPFSAGNTLFVPTDNSDIFCAGHSALPDGRLLVTGGTEWNTLGLDHTNVFDPVTKSWLNPRPSSMRRSRWYPTNTTLPDGRVFVSSGYEHYEMMSFGGNDGTVDLGDVVVFGLRGIPVDTTYAVAGPTARQGHAAGYDATDSTPASEASFKINQRMVIFGGLRTGGSADTLSDVWGLTRNEYSQNWQWTQLFPTADGTYGRPAARAWATFVYEDTLQGGGGENSNGTSLVLFGGLDSLAAPRNDVWMLHLKAGAFADKWQRVIAGGAIPARYGHSAVYVNKKSQRRMVVFGGRDGSTYFNDVWQLSLGAGTPTWSQVSTTGPAPVGRAFHTAVYDAIRNRMVIFGGRTASDIPDNKVWTLTFGATVEATAVWDSLVTTPDAQYARPTARYGHGATYDPEYDRLLVHGGDTTLDTGSGVNGELWHVRFESSNYADSRTWKRLKQTADGGSRYGHSSIYDTRRIDAWMPEVFDPVAGGWSPSLPDTARRWLVAGYPLMFVLPTGANGQVFYAGYDKKTRVFDLQTSTWGSEISSDIRGASAVMYRPGKIMKCGEEQDGLTIEATEARFISFLGSGNPTWKNTGDMNVSRTKHNLTLLPTGDVIATGGIEKYVTIAQTTTIIGPRTRPEIWDPKFVDLAGDTVGQWGGLLDDEPVARDYHSAALLLPDATILSGGGQVSAGRDSACTFWPPYLFTATGALATRPVITGADTVVAYGQTFYACLAVDETISSVCLIKPGAVTHQFNQDQRYVPLSFTRTGKQLLITAPASGKWAPPGDYMLFVLNSSSVPSIAKWIRLGTATQSQAWTLPETIWTTSNGPHFVSDTLTIPSGLTLTVSSGATVTVSGSATTIRVEGGTLNATGATFAACGGTWAGIHVVSGTATLTSCSISNADIGVDFNGGTGGGTVTSCRITSPGIEGIRINNNATVTVDQDTIECPTSSNFVAIHVGSSAGTTNVNRCRIIGKNASGSKGILCDKTASLLGNHITNFNASNARGIEFDLSDSLAVPIVDVFTLSGDTTYTVLRNCRDAFYIGNFSRPKIRRTRVDSTTTAIRVTSAAYANAGKEFDQGRCDVTNTVGKHVHAATRVEGFPDIDAISNWWGTADASQIAAKMTAHVNWSPQLVSDPYQLLSEDGLEVVRVSTERAPAVLGNSPNPFRDQTRVLYFVPTESMEVQIGVFNVSGQRVRGFRSPATSRGEGSWTWDGRDDGGSQVGSGIYYYRVRIGEAFSESRKMLLLK